MREGLAVAAAGRRVVAGVSGSLRSLGSLRGAGGGRAFRRARCPLLLRLWGQAARERMRAAFEEAFGGLPYEVTVRQMVVRGSPGPVLVGMAEDPDDLLVVGFGGRSTLGYAVHGAVTRYCMRRARCPVLAVPPPEMISQLRPWPHHWRAEDFIVPLTG